MKQYSFVYYQVVFTFIISLLSSPVIAQNKIGDTDTFSPTKQKASLYYLGERNELLIKVNIWGFVQKPGQYLVPTDTDLISLISYAGGPLEEAKLKKVKLIRNEALLASNLVNQGTHLAMNGTTAMALGGIKNDQPTPKNYKKVITIDVNKFLQSGNESLIPELKPGDTIVLEGSTFHLFSRVFEFASKLAVFAQIYFWVEAAKK
ncbi:MAG: hypothetical protein DWQ05_15465 [Calditrichaeota bacterium]|nr:MAG: hypothetical protein DWQ05_15465 [Calditrichota bacterium]